MNHNRWSHLLWIFLCSFLCNYCERSEAVPIFTRQPKSQIIVTGRNATLECKANANNEEIKYLWKLNGSYINEDNRDGFKITEGSLQIYNITWSTHNGAYECIALTKGLGAIKSKIANLQIAYFYIKDKEFSKHFDLNIKQSFLLLAPTYKALPAPTIVWHFLKSRSGFMDIAEMKGLFVTSQGHILIPSLESFMLTGYRARVYHPTSGTKPAYIGYSLLKEKIGRDGAVGFNSSFMSFPTVRTRTVPEGSNVTFDCLTVAIRWDVGINIAWTKKGDQGTYLNETSRRLTLNNVTKKNHQGVYECKAEYAKGGPKLNKITPFVLNVVEIPKLVKAVSLKMNLPADGILHPAVFSNGTSLSWYKDGDIINNTSILFEVYPNGNLRIKNPSPAFNGIYQMFYENQAGIVVVSREVNVNINTGCGQRIFKLSGSITYNQDAPTWNDITCTWLFQLPSAKQIQIKITKFNFRKDAILSVFEGSTASKGSLAKYSFSVASVSGPFISMVFSTKAFNVGGFTVDYWLKSEGPPTTVATPSKIKTSTSKPTTIKPTTQKPVKGKQKGGKGGSNTGAIVGGIFGVLVLIALILLVIYREKVLQKCGRSGSANVKTGEPTSVPMLEVDTSKQAC